MRNNVKRKEIDENHGTIPRYARMYEQHNTVL